MKLKEKFGERYSKSYDQFYKKKDYAAECDYLEYLFKRYKLNVKSILDIGCGTGGHLIELKKRGYEVTGVDQSQYMLDIASKKLKKNDIECDLYCADITNFNVDCKYDIIISMFTVMGYMNTNEQLLLACRNIFNHINLNGNFIFDVWYGPAVLTDPPQKTSKKETLDNKEFIRYNDIKLDTFNHRAEITYSFIEKENDEINFSDTETHVVRYFFPQEIVYFLSSVGFKKIDCHPFMKIQSKLTDLDWNMAVVAHK